MGTLRIIFATKGLGTPPFITGFFESLIWLAAISQIMSQLDNVYCYLAFSAGFASGNVVGILLEKNYPLDMLWEG